MGRTERPKSREETLAAQTVQRLKKNHQTIMHYWLEPFLGRTQGYAKLKPLQSAPPVAKKNHFPKRFVNDYEQCVYAGSDRA